MEFKARSWFHGKYTSVEVMVDGTTVDLGMMRDDELVEFVSSLVCSAYGLLNGDKSKCDAMFSRMMDDHGIEYVEIEDEASYE